MLVDESVTSLDANGSLIIACHFGGLPWKWRYTPGSEGFSVQSWQKEIWVDDIRDPNIPILTAGKDETPNQHIEQYLQTIPEELCTRLEPFRYLQTSMLKLAMQGQSGRDLAMSNPVLLWLSVDYFQKNKTKPDEQQQLLSLKQRDLLAKINRSGNKSKIKILKKIRIAHGNYEGNKLILWAMKNEELLSKIAHFSTITVRFLSVVHAFPEIMKSRMISSYMKGEEEFLPKNSNDASLLRTCWRDTGRLGYNLGFTDVEPALHRCTNMTELQHLHDSWMQRYISEERVQADVITFPRPPVAGNAEIVAILNSQVLILEGQLMKHCVGTYVDEILNGDSYIYKVLSPERATVEIGLNREKLYIKQCKLMHNQDPSAETMNAIKAWLRD